MKRGFLTTSKAQKQLEKEPVSWQYAQTKTIMSGPLSHGVVQEAGAPKDYRSLERAYHEIDGNTMNYAPDAYIYTTVPPISMRDTLADVPGGWTECFVSGHVKRMIYSTPGFPRLPLRPTGGKAYRIINAGDKGLGMFATRLIRTGDVIADERPMLVGPIVNPVNTAKLSGEIIEKYSTEQLKQIALHEAGEAVKLAFDRLPPEYKRAFMELYNSHKEDGSNEFIGRTRTNGFAINGRLRDENTKGRRGMYTATCNEISRINHSCSPNATFSWHDDTFSVRIHAVRDIPAGTEITIQYCDLLESVAERANDLAPYGITSCNCTPFCSDPAMIKISDERRARFQIPVVLMPPSVKPKADEPKDAWVQPALTRLLELEEEGLQSLDEYRRTLHQLLNIYTYLQDVEKVLMYAQKLRGTLKALGRSKDLDKGYLSVEGIKSSTFWNMADMAKMMPMSAMMMTFA
ncbi:hypothetical protein GGU10DRAFT_294936 [Lentinula aff. detonsa]|uniref:SET domain-containing protein n=1 Tax=Lentinula aff. detonsa TaxID=2804958 RepID=A0AA38KP52_9AGAR|nr:hypothetical protein GGU10DRAFT_294936 [Lentinula aff. detonsa]